MVYHFQQPKNEGFSARWKFKVNYIFLIGTYLDYKINVTDYFPIINGEICVTVSVVLLPTHGKIKLFGTKKFHDLI